VVPEWRSGATDVIRPQEGRGGGLVLFKRIEEG
jgi:hypothetical protein